MLWYSTQGESARLLIENEAGSIPATTAKNYDTRWQSVYAADCKPALRRLESDSGVQRFAE